MSDLSCVQMHELAAEMALDVLAGYERATAQAHLNECPNCRSYVGSLTQVSDRMLTLVPGVEPPVGFEDRVLARMGLTPPPVRQKRRWWPMAAAAAVAALVFGVGGWAVGTATTANTITGIAIGPSGAGGSLGDENEVLRFAALRTPDHQQDVGQVFTYDGQSPWVYMSVNTGTDTGPVTCELIRNDGTMVQVGTFALNGGSGSWGAELAVDPAQMSGAELVSATTGKVVASASFGTGAGNGTYPTTPPTH